jgi:sugar transferase (PEP-CTERM/EpsH1 system associated)
MAKPTSVPRHIPLVAHIIYRLDIGGLENGLVNIINGLPEDRYRHAIICLTEYSNFRFRIRRPDVTTLPLQKREGKDIAIYAKLWRLLRKLRPDIVHTRNLPTVDSLLIAAIAGVPYRIHGEHGRDMFELHGQNRKYNMLRLLCRPFVHRYISVSRDLAMWLREEVGVPERKIVQIYNGVDTRRFSPRASDRMPLPVADFAPLGTIVIGNIGRMAPVKDPLTLVRAFLHLLEMTPDGRQRLRLVLVGDGVLRTEIEALVRQEQAINMVWLAGARDDVPQLLRGFDIFALPSLAEGISNTILEAMASGLPVVATRVGGTPEIIVDGVTGMLVPSADPTAMARALSSYIEKPGLMKCHGRAGRERVERVFSIERMVQQYEATYEELLARRKING